MSQSNKKAPENPHTANSAADASNTRECPHCHQQLISNSEGKFKYFPFCSQRCQHVDLWGWFSETHAIPSRDFSGDVELLHDSESDE